MADAFDRIARPASGAAPRRSGGAPPPLSLYVAPVPEDAPPPLASHIRHGAPSAKWTYRDREGGALFHVARFDAGDGSKVVLPLTLWREAGKLRWQWKAARDPRPLYGLHDLAVRPPAPVLIVEGEKTADAAAMRFPDYVVLTWPGGSKATGKVDWSPLAGRDAVIWPDADEAGRKAGEEVARRATSAGALKAAIVDLPGFLPPGWDLADDWPEGFGPAAAEAAIAEARRRAQSGGVEWPWGFRMEPDGLWYDQPTPQGVSPTRLTSHFEVLALARDPQGGGWSVLVRFLDPDNREHTVAVSRARLANGAAEVRAELAGEGLVISPQRGKADKFAIALAEVKSARRLTLVAATGWCGNRFVLPGRVIGPIGGEEVRFTGEAPALHYRQAGSLERWRSGVAAKAEGNALMTFALSLAFLGPLLRPLELEGGGVHFRGSSSCGKTTLAYAAGSVWGGGGPLGFGQTWRATANALEMVAYGHNDGLAVFDELALVAPEEAGAAAYSLASGQSKARSRADGSLRARSEWRVAILSTGENGLADHIRAGRRNDRPMAGQELRLLDIAAGAGSGMGVWQELHGAVGPAELSDSIRSASCADYGHAGPAFLERLIADRPAAIIKAKATLAQFIARASRAGDSGQAQRAALRFGAVAAAGELAATFGVTPWQTGWALGDALWLYHRWASAFGRDTPHERSEIIRLLRGAIESQRSAFSPIGDRADGEDGDKEDPSPLGRDGEARSLVTLGFRQVRGPVVTYLFHPSGWRTVLKGHNAVEAAKAVEAAGFLIRDGDGRLQKTVSIRGEKHKLYAVSGAVLQHDVGD